jgi:hypothetical protein
MRALALSQYILQGYVQAVWAEPAHTQAFRPWIVDAARIQRHYVFARPKVAVVERVEALGLEVHVMVDERDPCRLATVAAVVQGQEVLALVLFEIDGELKACLVTLHLSEEADKLACPKLCLDGQERS